MSTSGVGERGAKSGKFKSKNAAGNRSDIGWTHGTDVDNNSRRVKCNHCHKTFSGGIYRFKHHLAGTRKDVEPCLVVPDDVKKQMLELIMKTLEASEKKRKYIFEIESNSMSDEIEQSRNKGKNVIEHSFSRKSSTQSTINQMMKKDLREEACQQIARFFYTSAIPFNCVKNPEFLKIFDLIGKYGVGFKPPSYHEIREKYLKNEVNRTMGLLEEYKVEWKKTGCSIMSDGWSDKKRRSICNFLVNSPKGTVFLSSVDTSEISKTAEKVFGMLDEIVEKIGEEHVVQVVTDNAANYKAAGELLMAKRKKLYWTPCAAHCIDLILEDFEKKLNVHSITISKGRKVATYIYSRTMLISMLRHFTKGRDLIRPAATRFATSYLTLGCFNDLKCALMSLFSSKQWKESRFAATQDGKQVQATILDSRFWKNIVTCLKAAYPLIKVLRVVDSEQPAMGFIYEEMDRAKAKIQANFNNVRKSYEPIWRIIDERWELQLHRPLHAAAYYLNPHFHYSSDFKVDARVKIGLYKCIEKMVEDPADRCKIDLQIESFKDAKGLFGIEAAKIARTKKPPAKWWDSYGDECPELQKFAIRILSLTCSSSGCERNWSAFEMVHTKRRNCLHQKKMNDLVFVMYNLKLKDGQDKKRCDELQCIEELDSDDEWITDESKNLSENERLELGVFSGSDMRSEELLFDLTSGNDGAENENVENQEARNNIDIDDLCDVNINLADTSIDLELHDVDIVVGGSDVGLAFGDDELDDDDDDDDDDESMNDVASDPALDKSANEYF